MFLPTCLLMNSKHPVFDTIFDMFVGCFMYADDVILLSYSLNDLQSMLNVSSQLMLKFNTNKCKGVAFGKMEQANVAEALVSVCECIQYLLDFCKP